MRTFGEKPKSKQLIPKAKSIPEHRGRTGNGYDQNLVRKLKLTNWNQEEQQYQQSNPEEINPQPIGATSPSFEHDFSRIQVGLSTTGLLQTKLEISKPEDIYEQEANRIAEHILRMPDPAIGNSFLINNRQASCIFNNSNHRNDLAQQKLEKLSKKTGKEVPSQISEVLSSPGQAIHPATRNFMESRFQKDFSTVRVHVDEKAVESTRALQARAYTIGQDIVFGLNQYSPQTESGQLLLAHELTHVLQQSTSTAGGGGVQVLEVAPNYVQRYESYEHQWLGDSTLESKSTRLALECHNIDLPEHKSPVKTWPKRWQVYYSGLNKDQKKALRLGLTYGEIVALSGDFYSDFDALNRAPLREVIDLIPLVRNRNTTTEQFQMATGGRYVALAEDNINHFSNVETGRRNRDTWHKYHIEALIEARQGNSNLAWGLNAFADHFLTDAFSSGHLRTQRDSQQDNGTTGKVRSKIEHDLDSAYGVFVTNDLGHKWTAYGDNHLKQDSVGKRVLLKALQLSRKDIAEALTQGSTYPMPSHTTIFEAERLIPRPVNINSSRWTKQDWIQMLKDIAEKELPGQVAELEEADDYVRDWIFRMNKSAFKRLPTEDIVRMLKVLFSGHLSQTDQSAIKRLLCNISDEQVMNYLRKESTRVDMVLTTIRGCESSLNK